MPFYHNDKSIFAGSGLSKSAFWTAPEKVKRNQKGQVNIKNGPITILVEETIASFDPPKNNTFPLWCYGAPTITRSGDRVYATIPDVSSKLPPMCNTRMQLFSKQGDQDWRRIYVNPNYDQREPCPVAHLGDGRVVVSINTAVAPFRGSQEENWLMWRCEPYLLFFNEDQPGKLYPETVKPDWDSDWPFTDHSYRGLATDPAAQELFVMNIEGYQWKPGPQGRYHWAFRDAAGGWPGHGLLEFPVRCCYPCISLKNRRVDIVAISDMDEPNAEWMAYKREYAGTAWDFDFRKLHYVYAADITRGGFSQPVVIEDCDATHGHIKHLDLYVDADNVAHVLLISRNISKPFMRDRFWPGQRLTAHLKVIRVKDGRILSEQILAACPENPHGRLWTYGKPEGDKNTGDSFRSDHPAPLDGAFHATPDGRLFVIYTLGGFDPDGRDLAEMFLVDITAGKTMAPLKIDLEDPLKIFFTAPLRNGSTPGYLIDLFGIGKAEPNAIKYIRIQLAQPSISPQG